MTTGLSSFSDISSLVADIHAGALFTLREQNVLVRTVRVYRDQMGMQPRKISRYNAANVRQASEGDDVTATQFTPSNLATLTPARYVDQFLLSDQRVASDFNNVRADAAVELGAAFAQYVDEQIATNFGSLNAGTVGAAGSALTWASVMNARALLQAAQVPGPYYCALHPYQWLDLVASAAVTGAELTNAPQFQDALISTYFVSTIVGGVTFVVTSAIEPSGSDATGAMYNPWALVYDERKPFTLEPQRDASREATELNASLWFAHGVGDAGRGVQIISDVTAP